MQIWQSDHPAQPGLSQALSQVAFSGGHGLGVGGDSGLFATGTGDGGAIGQQDACERGERGFGTFDGVKLPPATLDREARRQGERARRVRPQEDERACQASPQTVQPELVLEPYQMIIQLDAWNIRERDQWGQTEALRKVGQEPERWHWVYTGTCFRLDHRGKTAGGRPIISERGFVATREGIEGLREQMHAEALRRGLGQAAGVLVIGDGAMWIWRLADDRFKEARQRLDFYHAVQHLAAVGRVLFAEDPAKLKNWLRPLVRQLKHQSAVKVVEQLEEILTQLPAGATAQTVKKR